MTEETVKFVRADEFGLTDDLKSIPIEKKVFGVTTATVINNIDCNGEGRVQLMLPWLPGYFPWARMATPMAGIGRGTYFIPQIGEEVIVAFNHGDVRDPFVLGATWNAIDRPPALSPTDPVTTRKIRTPLGHEINFDEVTQTVTLSSNTMSTVTLGPDKAEISTPTANVTIGKLGDVTIKAIKKISLEAPIVEIKAATMLNIESQLGPCVMRGNPVKIN